MEATASGYNSLESVVVYQRFYIHYSATVFYFSLNFSFVGHPLVNTLG
jgi:hypothetical protein